MGQIIRHGKEELVPKCKATYAHEELLPIHLVILSKESSLTLSVFLVFCMFFVCF